MNLHPWVVIDHNLLCPKSLTLSSATCNLYPNSVQRQINRADMVWYRE